MLYCTVTHPSSRSNRKKPDNTASTPLYRAGRHSIVISLNLEGRSQCYSLAMSDDLTRGSRRAPRVKRELGSAGVSNAGRAGGERAGVSYADAAAASLAKRDKRCACICSCAVLGLLRLGESRFEVSSNSIIQGFGYLRMVDWCYHVCIVVSALPDVLSTLHYMSQTRQSDRQAHLCLDILPSVSAARYRDRYDAEYIRNLDSSTTVQ